jgi:general secretion pathway protein D
MFSYLTFYPIRFPSFSTTFLIAVILFNGSLFSQGLPKIDLPKQAKPPILQASVKPILPSEIGPNTNLVLLLDQIRTLTQDGELGDAQKVATTALENLDQSEQNEFYLRQIKAEETKLYFKLANRAMLDKQYSQASQYIERYRENVAAELQNRKIRREIKTELGERKDVSLVGRLVEELDQAKKDLAQIRAKSGLPKDDAQPDLERLVADEKAQMERSLMTAENLLRKARFDSAQGRYDEADKNLDEALGLLTPNAGTIAMISDLYKAKQQTIWYRVGEAMLKGKVAEVQELTLTYKETEESRRKLETNTLGVSAEIDFDAEIRKANEKNKEQAKFAEEMLDESKELIKKKEYERAEKILLKISNFLEPSTLTWPLILEASLIKNRINLSKADDAREDKDWDKAKELLDEFRTGFYSDRNIQGDTLTYGRPGLKETFGEDAVERELGLADAKSNKIRSDMMDPFKRDITEFTPEWKEQQEQLKELLMRAKVQFINGDLTGATETYRVIETRYSDNFEAKEMLKRISLMRQQESYLGYIKTRQEMLEEIEREWERPKVFDRQIEETKEVEEGPSNIEAKLKLIEIPGVDFFNSPLSEAMTELQRQARLFDLTEPDPAKKGLNIIPLIGEEEEPTVNIKLNAMALGKMIEFITEMVGWTFDVRSDAVVIQKTGGTFKGRPLETEFYQMQPGTVQRLTGSSSGGGADADPFAAPAGGGDGAGDEGIKIRAFLENTGIPFIDAKGHKFAFDGFQMIITHERRYLDLIERILSKLDEESSKQVEIEAKFLEVQEGALDEISFDWQYSWGDAPMAFDPDTGNPLLDSNNRLIRSYDKTLTGNTRTLASAHSPSGTSRDTLIRMEEGGSGEGVAGSVNDLKIPNPIPNLPGKIGIGAGVSPLTKLAHVNDGTPDFTEGMIIGSSQASLMISALKRKQGTDLLSAPRVTVMDGQSATITVAQEFIYPTEYEPAPPPTIGGGGGNNDGGGLGGAIQIQSAIPQFETVAPLDEQPGFREVGVVLNVTPTIEKYNSINLKLTPKVTEFDGFIEYGGNSAMIGTSQTGSPPLIIQPSGILMPIFSVRKVDTQVSIFDGATVIIGGLTREEVKTVNDKIPVLGNIPLIGKLFQSNAESYQKRNLLIFVSASIVSKGGSPVREVIQNISPQSIFKDPVIMTPTGTIRRTFKEEDGGDN